MALAAEHEEADHPVLPLVASLLKLDEMEGGQMASPKWLWHHLRRPPFPVSPAILLPRFLVHQDSRLTPSCAILLPRLRLEPLEAHIHTRQRLQRISVQLLSHL